MTINAVETPEEPTAKRKEAWDNARMAELLCVPATPQAKALVEEALSQTFDYEAAHDPRKRKIKATELASLKQGLGAFLGDLLLQASNTDAWGYMYRPQRPEWFSSTLCSSRNYQRLRRFWTEMRWIRTKAGFCHQEDFDGGSARVGGKAERLKPTVKLLELALSYGITPGNAKDHFKKEHKLSSPIEVKTRKKPGKNGKGISKRMAPPRIIGLETAKEQVRDLNAFYEQHSFNLPEVPCLKRTFHNGDDPDFSYDQGGRLYCTTKDSYQSLSKAERSKITINGEPTSEVDVSGSFPFILHHALKVPFPQREDIYDIEGIERMVVKKIVVARIGSEDWPKQWPKNFAKDYEAATGKKLKNRYTLKKVVAAVREHFPVLDMLDQKRMGWAKLQFLESTAILMAIETLKDDHGIAALPVHDSLIVPSRFVEEAKAALEGAYCFCFGSSPKVTATTS